MNSPRQDPVPEFSPENDPAGPSVREIAWLFLRLGATSFGGPAAHIALMEREVVRRLGWLPHDRFVDLLGATHLIPGPNSTEMAIHIGWSRARWAGLIVAGVCFIAPAALITLGLAWAYVRFGTRPEAAALLYGIKPVIIAVVADALWRLGRSILRTRLLAAVTAAAAIMNALWARELAILFGCGLLVMSIEHARGRLGLHLCLSLPPLVPAVAAPPARPELMPLFLFFLKVGSILYGSGYVLLAFLRADLVERWGWLNDRQLLDAIAIGQITPGPVFTTATFIGYLLGRLPGAGLATLGIFLPSFVLVAASGPLIPRIRQSRLAGAFLDGVNAASLALMLVVSCELGRSALVDPLTTVVAAVSGVFLIRRPINSAWLILAGGLLGAARLLLS
ncbi:MAG: chromate efflux transporter [Isosphaeraceae bacterium]